MKRQKGEGSITQLPNGTFRIRVETQPINGKRQWLSETTQTKTDAVKVLKKLQRTKEDQQLKQTTEEQSIGHYIEPYLLSRRAEGVKESSLQAIRGELDRMSSYFGMLSLDKITIQTAEKYLITVQQRGVSKQTYNVYLSHIKGFFEWLSDRDIIEKDVFKRFKPLKNRGKLKKNLEVLSTEEHNHLKALMLDKWYYFVCDYHRSLKYRMYAAYLLAYETGMRAGELSGLKWSCVDFSNHTVGVENNIVVINNTNARVRDCEPKTAAGYRTITISKDTMKVLSDLKATYKTLGITNQYVFANGTNKPYEPVRFTYVFKKYLEEAGITRHFVFHDIRHTNASLLIDKKVEPLVIAERLGHSSVNVSYNVYGHIIDREDKQKKVIVTA